MRKTYVIRTLFLSMLLVASIMFTGCDSRGDSKSEIIVSEIITSGSVLYNDNGDTFLNLYARVHDRSGFPITGTEVSFKSDIQQLSFLPARAISDNSGIAKTIVWVSGNALLADQDERIASIEAFIGTKFQKRVNIIIKKTVEVEQISIITNIPDKMRVDQSIIVKAQLTTDSSELIPDGTMVTFETTGLGYFISNESDFIENYIQVPVTGGIASARFNTGTIAGMTTVTAKIGAISDTKSLEITSANPNSIYLQLSNTAVNINSQENIEISAFVTDRYANPVKDRIVTFSTSLGNLYPNSQITNENGKATVAFVSGSVAGQAQITAQADSISSTAIIQILASEVRSMRFTNENSISLNVQGPGGVESIPVGVLLYDMAGNIVEEQHRVRFELVSHPGGVMMNNSEAQTVDVYSYGGEAQVSISSGTFAGIVVLRATLLDSSNQTTQVSVQRSNIVIHAGFASNIEIFTPSSAVLEGGDGSWEMILAAKITDRWGNPVSDGLGVTFGVENQNAFQDSVSINAAVFTGNQNLNGNSTHGHAYTSLVYHGRVSNLIANIYAITSGADPITGNYQELRADLALTLPMNGPLLLDMVALPAVLEWNLDTEYNTNGAVEKRAEIRVIVKDRIGNPIRKAPLIFYTSRGQFKDDGLGNPLHEAPTDYTVTPYEAITGYDGIQKKGIFYSGNIFTMIPAPPVETLVEIGVMILGHEANATTTMILRGWWGI